MSYTGKHYHLATGRDSVNRGKYYLCMNKRMEPVEACCIEPAYRMEDGGWLIHG